MNARVAHFDKSCCDEIAIIQCLSLQQISGFSHRVWESNEGEERT